MSALRVSPKSATRTARKQARQLELGRFHRTRRDKTEGIPTQFRRYCNRYACPAAKAPSKFKGFRKEHVWFDVHMPDGTFAALSSWVRVAPYQVVLLPSEAP